MSKEGQGSGGQPPKKPACVPKVGEKVVQEFQILMKKVGGSTEVLLIGEMLDGMDIQGTMNTFVEDLFSATCHPVHPVDTLKETYAATCSMGGQQCQLIFFLCQALSLKNKPSEVRKVLTEVKKLIQRTPCALVGVIMDPTKGEAEGARNQMLQMLRSVFPKPVQKRGKQASGKAATTLELENIEVEAEIYVPGQSRGNLAIMKAACRASEALTKSGSSWTSLCAKAFLGIVCVTSLACGVGWYLYTQGLIPPELIPTDLFSLA